MRGIRCKSSAGSHDWPGENLGVSSFEPVTICFVRIKLMLVSYCHNGSTHLGRRA